MKDVQVSNQLGVIQFFKYNSRDLATVSALLLLCLVITVIEPVFLSSANLLNVITQSSINAIIAIGMTFVILSAGIDLSVGSIVAFSGVVLGSALQNGFPMIVAILIGLAVGVLCGVVNGVVIAKGNIPPFIATLGMMSIARGFALVWTGGRSISGFSDAFRWFGEGRFLGIPSQIIITIVLYFIAWYVLKFTKIGRNAYAIGGNEEATRLSGINIDKFKIILYSINGLTAAIASIILAGRLNSAQPIAGINYELDAIAAVTIGGTSQRGGEGKIQGSLIGALIMGVLRNGLNLADVSSYIQQIVIGTVIILAVMLDMKAKQN